MDATKFTLIYLKFDLEKKPFGHLKQSILSGWKHECSVNYCDRAIVADHTQESNSVYVLIRFLKLFNTSTK